jgi:hypothetical protein
MSHISLSDLQKHEIKLSFLAWEDMSQLNVHPHSDLLKSVWDSTRQEIASFCDCISEDFHEIADAFRTCELALYPKISIGFDAEGNLLIVNIWSWMFSVLSLQSSDAGFALPFMKAGELFHELSHFNYLKENGMINASETESNAFKQQHGSEMEEIAFRKQIEVLEHYKKPETSLNSQTPNVAEGRGRDLNPGARLHRPMGYQATSPRPLLMLIFLISTTFSRAMLFSFAEDFAVVAVLTCHVFKACFN